jgi:hypothetical protein
MMAPPVAHLRVERFAVDIKMNADQNRKPLKRRGTEEAEKMKRSGDRKPRNLTSHKNG